MKLKNAHVRFFRNVLDGGEVEFQGDVTCLVGKNESGKTSFLQALYRLNPAVTTPFDLMDYPAWRSKTDRLEGKKLEEETPISAEFELDDSEQAALVEAFGPASEGIKSVRVARKYKGELTVLTSLDERRWLADFISAGCTGLSLTSTPTSVKALGAQLQALTQQAPPAGAADSRPVATKVLKTLQERAGENFDLTASFRSWVEKRLPKFLYFGRYHTLKDDIDVARVSGAAYEKLNEEDRIAKALLELSSADVKVAAGSDYERRKRELNDTANALTLQILEYWSQNENLRVEMDFEEVPPRNEQPPTRRLHVRLYDSEHMVTLPFGERSSGFQWFFSFLCAFSRYRRSGETFVLLLDEPALGLHARAQSDFLKYIDEKLASKCQVIYSTHSPFMVQPARLERVRLVEDKGRKKGSTITAEVLTTDADTLFPLQGALGYDLAQNLFVGPYNLLVEGTSDLVYLQVVSDFLRSEKRTALDQRCTFVPVGGAGHIATFAALLGSHVDATILIDSTRQKNQRLDQLIQQGILKKSRVIGVGEVLEKLEADVEDLFAPDEYLKLFNAAFGKKYKPADLQGTDPIVRRLARADGQDRFDHGRPADYFMRHSSSFVRELSPQTLANFERLFARINSTFSSGE